jgi:hypothetical protein
LYEKTTRRRAGGKPGSRESFIPAKVVLQRTRWKNGSVCFDIFKA